MGRGALFFKVFDRFVRICRKEIRLALVIKLIEIIKVIVDEKSADLHTPESPESLKMKEDLEDLFNNHWTYTCAFERYSPYPVFGEMLEEMWEALPAVAEAESPQMIIGSAGNRQSAWEATRPMREAFWQAQIWEALGPHIYYQLADPTFCYDATEMWEALRAAESPAQIITGIGCAGNWGRQSAWEPTRTMREEVWEAQISEALRADFLYQLADPTLFYDETVSREALIITDSAGIHHFADLCYEMWEALGPVAATESTAIIASAGNWDWRSALEPTRPMRVEFWEVHIWEALRAGIFYQLADLAFRYDETVSWEALPAAAESESTVFQIILDSAEVWEALRAAESQAQMITGIDAEPPVAHTIIFTAAILRQFVVLRVRYDERGLELLLYVQSEPNNLISEN